MRKQTSVRLSVLFLILGVLFGYATAELFGDRATPEAQPLPFDAPLENSQMYLQGAVDNPEGYSESAMAVQGYLGIHNQRIAIFQGEPPNGTLQYVTDYEVREDLRHQLETGVPFTNTGELFMLLENYTS